MSAPAVSAAAPALRRPRIKVTPPGPKAADWVARDTKALSPSFTRPYPLVIERGEGVWVTDVDGNEYLDLTAGIAVGSTGHSHPKVVEAIEQQARKFLHMSGTDFYYEPEIRLAERLTKGAPVKQDAKVFFTNSGAESIEGAMKLARWNTKRQNFIAFYGAFHGRTMGALSLTGSKAIQRDGFGPLVPGVWHVPYPSASNGGTSEETFDRIEEIFHSVAKPESFAAIVVEPIQGEGGYVVPPADFLPRLRTLTQEHGILLVCDEIQSGMGRTGQLYAVEHSKVQPDIVTLAKGIASGMPLGAIIAGAGIMNWPPGSHGSTFGGNPVSCAAGLATLDLIEGGLMQNAAVQGKALGEGLQALKAKHGAMITDVRGRGLMQAIELTDGTAANALMLAAFTRGLLTLPVGSRALRLSPGLNINAGEIAVGLEILDAALGDLR